MKNILLLTIFVTSLSFATETKFVTDEGFHNVWLWQLSNTTVKQEQGLSIAPKNEKLYSTPQLLWSGKYINGNLYLGTAETAKVLKIDSSNKEEEIFSMTNHALISDIVADGDGLLIAASPDSALYHLDNQNNITSNTTLTNTYIWDIVPNPQGGFDILTGSTAAVYSYNNYTLSDPITIENEDHLLEGIYIDDTLWILGEHGVYKKENDKIIAVTMLEGEASGFTYTNNSFYVIHSITVEANPAANQSEQITSKLSRISLDTGLVEELYSLQGSYFTSINIYNQQIFIGADQYGLYISYDLVTNKNYYANLGSGKILAIFTQGQDLLMLTSDSSALWKMGKDISKEASFISEVYDAGHISQWGIFSAKISTPPNTSVEFFVQSGVTSNPNYWSEWTPIENNQVLPIQSARYMRYKAVLKSENNNIPYIHSVQFPFTQLNIAPQITSTQLDRQENTITFSWSGDDANKDVLEYNVYLAEDGLPNILLTKTPIRETNYTFYQRAYPAGMKKITLVVSDRPSNSDDSQLTDQFVTLPIMFDGENPMVKNFQVQKQGDKAIITFTAKDLHSIISQAHYTINGQDRVRLLPTDGIFDSKEENFSFEITNTEARFIQVVISDKAENKATSGTTLLPQ